MPLLRTKRRRRIPGTLDLHLAFTEATRAPQQSTGPAENMLAIIGHEGCPPSTCDIDKHLINELVTLNNDTLNVSNESILPVHSYGLADFLGHPMPEKRENCRSLFGIISDYRDNHSDVLTSYPTGLVDKQPMITL
jgi:hypothetical protein